jgi:hypothetical protein
VLLKQQKLGQMKDRLQKSPFEGDIFKIPPSKGARGMFYRIYLKFKLNK